MSASASRVGQGHCGPVRPAAVGDKYRQGKSGQVSDVDPASVEPDVRRVIYTTDAIEALNRQLRRAIKTKGSFPSEGSAIKLLYFAIQNTAPQ